MTREQLEKYHDITVRLKNLKLTVFSDSVVGSSPEYPYTSHSIPIHGVNVKEAESLERKLKAMDDFMGGIEDVRTRTIAELRIKQNLSWPQVGKHMGESPDAVRMCFGRIFEK
jgi:hypothetical protein